MSDTIGKKPRKPGKFDDFFVVIGLIGLAYGAWWMFGPGAEKTPEEIAIAAEEKRFADTRYWIQGAQIRCMNNIKKILDDPTGADFGDVFGYPVELIDDSTVFVIAKFRAKNAYGVLTWAKIKCTVKDDNGKWNVTEFEKF